MSFTRRAALGAGAAMMAAPALAARGGGIGAVLDSHDALGLAALIRHRQISVSELLEATIARAEALNPRFNFMAQKHYDFARAAIAAGLPQGPFTGVPWLLKDLNTNLAGELTEGGSRFYKGFRPTQTSELVRRHQAAGFVIFGKTCTPEFGLTGTTENKLTGDTRNPWEPGHIAGGSSGGAAAAVAAGVLPAAHADGPAADRRLGRAVRASCDNPQCARFGGDP